MRSLQILVKQAVSKNEREECHNHVCTVYKDVFSVIPPEIKIMFVAREDSKIIGTLGYELSDKKGQMPLEDIFSFDRRKTPLPYRPKSSLQFSRWTSLSANATTPLLRTATKHALANGLNYALFEQKKSAVRVLRKMGIVSHTIRDAVIKIENVPAGVRSYYSSEPLPQLYMAEISQIVQAISKKY